MEGDKEKQLFELDVDLSEIDKKSESKGWEKIKHPLYRYVFPLFSLLCLTISLIMIPIFIDAGKTTRKDITTASIPLLLVWVLNLVLILNSDRIRSVGFIHSL